MRTIAGVFPSAAEAKDTAADLKKLGIADEEIIVAAAGDRNRVASPQRNISAAAASGWGWLIAGFIPEVIRQGSARAGATVGAGVGGAIGVIAGIVARAIPLSLVATFPTYTVAIVTGVAGAAAGALAAWVYGLGVSHETVAVCAEAAREHGVVVLAHVGEPIENEVFGVMREHDAAQLRDEADPWRATGWTGKPIDAHEYPSDSSVRSHFA